MTQIGNLTAILLASSLSVASSLALAGEWVGGRKITDLGCHNTNGVCFVSLDGAAFGTTLGCVGATNEFRFDNGDTAVGRRSYASFLAAQLAGKSVSVYLEGCSSQGSPNLNYFHIAS